MRWLYLTVCFLAACDSDPCVRPRLAADDAPPPPRHTPRWAFEPWVSKDISDTADTYAFVDGFLERGIPVGAVVLDSPWETHYNTFVPSPTRYPNFPKLVDDLHARGIRVVLWITQMVNNSGADFEPGGDTYTGESPNFAEAQACRYTINDGDTYFWWKGTGAAIDFFNKDAQAWWHRLADPLYARGIDGWKLDFGDSYVLSTEVKTKTGVVPHQAYSEAYYRDFLAYGAAKRGRDFVTMVRGWDASYGFAGRFYARPEHAPVVWAGDNRRDYIGLADALDTMFRSARAGYVMVGSDIGGYLDLDDKTLMPVPASQDVFARWTAVGALTPFMQLHGRANLTPWTLPERPEETVELYRDWSVLHHELVPFFYSLAEEAYAGGAPLLDPIGDEGSWVNDYRFTLGGVLLVAPILDETGFRDVALPPGGQWYDWFDDLAKPVAGGQTLVGYDGTDRKTLPLFVRSGAILPMRSAWRLFPAAEPSRFQLHEEDEQTTEIAAVSSGARSEITIGRVRAPVVLKVRVDRAVAGVTAGGAALGPKTSPRAVEAAASGWYSDGIWAWVKLEAGGETKVILE